MSPSPKRGPSVLELSEQFNSPEKCIEFLEQMRWPDGPQCLKCSSKHISRIRTRNLFQCLDCFYQFSVTVGTIFHRSHLPLRKWILATVLICNAKKGISAKQIERDLKVTYKTAWYLMHRIRRAMREPGFIEKFVGIVEVDDAYIGGVAHGKAGRGAANKMFVVGVRERGGSVRAEVAKDPKTNTVCSIVRKYVNPWAKMLCVDEFPAYNQLAVDYYPKRINHRNEYVRGQVHTNSIESFWNVLKRGIVGSFHKVSAKYLPYYLDEFTYRFSHTRNGNGVGLWKQVLSNGLIYDSAIKG